MPNNFEMISERVDKIFKKCAIKKRKFFKSRKNSSKFLQAKNLIFEKLA